MIKIYILKKSNTKRLILKTIFGSNPVPSSFLIFKPFIRIFYFYLLKDCLVAAFSELVQIHELIENRSLRIFDFVNFKKSLLRETRYQQDFGAYR